VTTLASTIVDRVRSQLIDTGADYRWTDAELLTYMSDAQSAVVAAIPTAYTKTVTTTLVAGTRQTVPADGYMALTVIRNTAGRAVTPVPRELFDQQYPNWHVDDASETVKHFFVESNDPKAYYCYPPNNGSGSVTLVYSAVPPVLAATTDTLSVDDIYATAIYDYTMYRAHQKDNDFAAGQAVAVGYLNAFAAFVTAQQGGEAREVPA
jgi:hypothetical protein